MHIVIIDDTKMNLLLLGRALKELGYEVDSFETGKEAVKFLIQNDVDLVITDMVMPNEDGLQLYERYLKACEIVEIEKLAPFVLLTATKKKSLTKKALKLGFHSVMTKPPSLAQLVQLVKETGKAGKGDVIVNRLIDNIEAMVATILEREDATLAADLRRSLLVATEALGQLTKQ